MTSWIGPRGLSILIFFGIIALALALVGWFSRNTVIPPLPNFSSQAALHFIVGGTAR